MHVARNRVPTNIKKLKGTDQPWRRNNEEPMPDNQKVEKPADLSDGASKIWDQIHDDLYGIGLLTNIDVNSLVMYCEAYAQWKEAHSQVIKNGPIYKDKKGVVKANPYIRIAQNSFDQVKSLMTQFGMTPSARSGIRVGDKKQETKNPFADLKGFTQS